METRNEVDTKEHETQQHNRNGVGRVTLHPGVVHGEFEKKERQRLRYQNQEIAQELAPQIRAFQRTGAEPRRKFPALQSRDAQLSVVEVA